jgi:hypothetical protein
VKSWRCNWADIDASLRICARERTSRRREALAAQSTTAWKIAAAFAFAVLAVLLTAGCVDDSRERPPNAAYKLESVGPVPCAGEKVAAKCFEAQITNVGEIRRQGTCTLRPRRGSAAHYADGATTQRMALSPGESVKLRIVVMAGQKGRVSFPSVYCTPGIGG